jgi:acyl-coenzyme A thioesterase PaaI-like protein
VDAPEGFKPFPEQGPFLEEVGPVCVSEDGGELRLGLRAEERHANHRGTVQGGLLSTLADFALGRAIEADAEDDRDRATVSLSTLASADCSLTVEDREIVRAQAVWVVAG